MTHQIITYAKYAKMATRGVSIIFQQVSIVMEVSQFEITYQIHTLLNAWRQKKIATQIATIKNASNASLATQLLQMSMATSCATVQILHNNVACGDFISDTSDVLDMQQLRCAFIYYWDRWDYKSKYFGLLGWLHRLLNC